MKTVFFDIDTQLDFVFPAGALYVPDAEKIVPAIARLNQYAATVVSTTCAHEEDDAEFLEWPPHCIMGTIGQMKPQSTLLADRTVVPNYPSDIKLARQIILQKQQLNLFTNPNLPKLLDMLGADEYVVYGVVTEHCVGFAALGLLDTGKPVTLVTDAIRSLRDEDAARTLQAFAAAGGKRSTVSEICSR